uniref:RES family NAD+ phosphorylase n=1 Tax=Arthrobacter sp. TaxID=1667 RepID=UPI000EB674AA|nr:RES family NAD+ phosphorylase [Arthrobacter sp.]AXV46722.1 RES domain protein [Arthrobacter sp.]
MPLEIHNAPHHTVWRVGYEPEPLSWSGWEHAHDGRFPGRWDDPDGRFRTLYLGATLKGCLLEVLAHARKDMYLTKDLEDIEEEPEDAQDHPTINPGEMDRDWLRTRCAAEATLSGHYCAVTAGETIAELHGRFIGPALDAGHDDFDASLLKNASPEGRKITRAVSAYLYLRDDIDGVEFASRHGDEERMWCVYEQPHEQSRMSRHLMDLGPRNLTEDTPELIEAFRLLGLRWRDPVN